MISYISIKNFAIIENSEVEFNRGLNVITGETGAGKSIVIEAISLALGARADSTFVRTGCDKAVVSLVADLEGEEVVITREVSASGKNLCKLNGEVVTLAELGRYCRKIADIHGQYDHQSLLNPDYHIHLIDVYHAKAIEPAKAEVANLFHSYMETKSRLSELLKTAAENAKNRDFMRFQLDEIRSANLIDGEDEELQNRINILQNSEKIYTNLSGGYEGLYDASPSALEIIKSVYSGLSEISNFSSGIEDVFQRLGNISYELEDITREVRVLRDSITFSQEELDESIARYDEIQKLLRKYGHENVVNADTGTISAVLEYANTLEIKLSNVENQNQLKATLEKELLEVTEKLTSACERLSELRKVAAAELSSRICSQLQDLNFSNSELEIKFTKLDNFTETGIDAVLFMISTNLGEPLKPLNKIASGGEMSRIMLAFKKIVADYDGIPTLIFDEIDSGISGIAASVVGKKLKEIAENHQIICITHLPQIAACGHKNYQIQKQTNETSTSTTILPLNDEEKIKEIARLLGGSNITDTTKASAKELIAASL